MFDRQADALRLGVLGSDLSSQTYLALKMTRIGSKKFKKLREGDVLDGFDPLHMRIIRDRTVIARAKLGQVDGRETIHIVSVTSKPLPDAAPAKKVLLEVRVRLLPDQEIAEGDLMMFDTPLTRNLLLLADGRPAAIADLVEVDDEAMLQIARVLP